MQLDALRNHDGKVWLNIASSTYPIEHFANLDNHIFLRLLDYPLLPALVPARNRDLLDKYRTARATPNAPMFRHDCRKPLPLPDNCVDHILCSHFLEHVFPDEAAAILSDFHRVLKPGATAHIIVPHLGGQIDEYLEARKTDPRAADAFLKKSLLSKENRGSLRYRLMELSGGFGLQHRWMYDQPSMEARVTDAGFTLLPGNTTPSAHWREGDDSVHVTAQK